MRPTPLSTLPLLFGGLFLACGSTDDQDGATNYDETVAEVAAQIGDTLHVITRDGVERVVYSGYEFVRSRQP